MRTMLLVPLTALVAVVGCSPETKGQESRAALQRDLTLAAPDQDVAFASPVELGRLRPLHQTSLPAARVTRSAPARRHKPHAPKVMTAVLSATAAPTLAVPRPVTEPAQAAPEAIDDRELLPGKTVTVIPASSGPSTTPEAPGDLPAIRGTGGSGMGGGEGSGMGGGGCRGRGPGIGIAGAPSPAFR
jgi:hypothetical protein